MTWRIERFLLAAAICVGKCLYAVELGPGVVATVDGEPITVADVERELAIAFPNRMIGPQARTELREQTVEQLIRRQLVLRYLRETKQSASLTEIDLAIDRLKNDVGSREQSWDEYLRMRQRDEAGLRQALGWQIGWSRLLAKYLTDRNLQRYFDAHRRDFDGTEIHVAHILFAVPESADASNRIAAGKQASEVLAKLRAAQLTFEEAARRYSSGPSREAGGDLGYISRHEPMPESFSRAAFQLEANQISEPVQTTFGIHLIRCIEIKPGQKRWMDLRADLEQAVTEYLFQWASDRVRPIAKVERRPFVAARAGVDGD